jgi:hypothetical protein
MVAIAPSHGRATRAYGEHNNYTLRKHEVRSRPVRGAVWTEQIGIHHQQLLPGAYDSPESGTAFAKLQLEHAATPSATAPPDTITVNEVLQIRPRRYANKVL